MSAQRIYELQKSKSQMKNLTVMDMVVIKAYYRMTTMKENMNWLKLTRLLSNFYVNLRGSICTVHVPLFQNYNSLHTALTI